MVVSILKLVHEVSSFLEVLNKRGDLKNISRFTVKHKSSHPEVFCQKKFLKILQNLQKKVFAGVSFLVRLQSANMKLSDSATGDFR